jgi:hypothetical protein
MEKNFSFIFAVLLCAGSLFVAPVYGQTQDSDNSDDWQFTADIYLWGAGIEGQSATGADVDIGFSDIISNLDFTFMGGLGAKKGKWGFMTDVIYLAISDDPNVALDPSLTLRHVGMKSWVVTPQVTYKVLQSDQWDLDLLAGARYLYMKAELQISPLPRKSDSGSGWDGIVGTRGQMNLNQKWFLPFHFDVGGGDTKLTWQAFGGVGYKFGSFDLVAGYRYLEWDFAADDKGGGTFNDLNISGPLLGAKFMF